MPSYHIDFDVYWTGARYFLDGGYVYGKSRPPPRRPPPLHLPTRRRPRLHPLRPHPYQASSVLFTLLSLLALYVVARYTLTALRTYGFAATENPGTRSSSGSSSSPASYRRQSATPSDSGRSTCYSWCSSSSTASPPNAAGGPAHSSASPSPSNSPMVFLLYFFWRRDWKSLGMTIGSLVAYNLIAFLVMPSTAKLYWTEIISDGERIATTTTPA
ncbi:MAG: glycosyltransferase family 87 protein [Lawsonella clevelandensis]